MRPARTSATVTVSGRLWSVRSASVSHCGVTSPMPLGTGAPAPLVRPASATEPEVTIDLPTLFDAEQTK